MTTSLRQSLAQKLGELPDAEVAQVIDFVDFLLYKQSKNGVRQEIQQIEQDSHENLPPQSLQKLRASRFTGSFEADPELASQSQTILRESLGDRQG